MENLEEHTYHVNPEQRSVINGHAPMLIWFTGLSGSGKSTLADALESYLIEKGIHAYHLDGDAIRMGLNSDLSFSEEDRAENMRRIGEVAELMLDAGLVVIAAFISPLRSQREFIRSKVGSDRMMEIFVNTPIEVCETRDIKGYYAKARKGEIAQFTGISAPYEPPVQPDIEIDTSRKSIEVSIGQISILLAAKGFKLP
jgi:adenylylsulfate kinase